ncbi:hypothetical protein KCP77_08490 [Salmonella enterica subsp. enterica]|nr:hypothetical protein KCP77_08490 [Salmonella enterica subsp. enterica]
MPSPGLSGRWVLSGPHHAKPISIEFPSRSNMMSAICRLRISWRRSWRYFVVEWEIDIVQAGAGSADAIVMIKPLNAVRQALLAYYRYAVNRDINAGVFRQSAIPVCVVFEGCCAEMRHVARASTLVRFRTLPFSSA